MRAATAPSLELDARVLLRRLEVFCVVVEEEGGVTRAAERLLLAQPAVSGQIRAPEGWLQTKLLERHGNHVERTEASSTATRRGHRRGQPRGQHLPGASDAVRGAA